MSWILILAAAAVVMVAVAAVVAALVLRARGGPKGPEADDYKESG